ncbi:MAG TPA: malonate transporter subunit MadL [Saprospiraceae bacterium]|nr:malonate transporter subunit MadL [Saprospiraceae bacterium]HPG06328.1 malonate transporter subunit MadL [Saprospiraceae bacterium]HRV86628.1 malonate transporter subunit MadL [Saprospiraceae bacterium]
MLIYGVAVLAGCYILGQLTGEILGRVLHIDANVGGVGFAMLFLILISHWMQERKLFTTDMEQGALFWSKMYIPVIVAMSAIQNVKGALSGGLVAILAGVIPTAAAFLMIPLLAKLFHAHPETTTP